jgi:tyrosyl-tRNA synthetase
MMSKDSVKKRLSSDSREGMSFTEFTYQLVQGYDFLHLYRDKNCKLQMGGSDQWGNITTGTELIRRVEGGDAFALTCPLITKADGGKFGKTEKGNVWLSSSYTSPYQFYQFWMNVSDADAEKFIKIFTLLEREEIERLIAEHAADPGLRVLQKTLARELTIMVHSEADYQAAVEASQILFGKGTTESLQKLSEADFLSIFEGVPTFNISKAELSAGIKVTELLTDKAAVFPSKGELRRVLEQGGLSINKTKIASLDEVVSDNQLLDEKYLLVQKGKKNYTLLIAE